jgi:DNA-directed RNA polymerase specialized sigma24 family protein
MIPMQQNGDHIDPGTLNFFIDGELQVGDEERIRQHVKRCRLCALYVVSGQELKAVIQCVGQRFSAGPGGTSRVRRVGNGNLVRGNSQPALRAAVRQLPPTLREVLLLCDREELSCRDIALQLDIPISAVISRISDARDTLCHLLILQLGKLQ